MLKSKKSKKKKAVLLGGKKLGEGGYGCVVKPAIPCLNRSVGPNAISKIIHVKDPKEYLNELNINYKLLKADPKQKYLILLRQECILNIEKALSRYPKDFIETRFWDKKGKDYSIIDPKRKKLSNNNIKQDLCKIDKTRKPRNIIMDYGGEDILEVVYRAYSHNYFLCKKYAFYIFKHILKGIKIMHDNNIAHRDIKPQNLMFLAVKKRHKKTGKLIEVPFVRIIDFGLAEDVSKLITEVNNRDIVRRRGTNGYKPIDIDILRHLLYYSTRYDIDEPILKDKTVDEALTVFSDSKLSTVYYFDKKSMKLDLDYHQDTKQEKMKKLELASNDAKALFDRYKDELKNGLLPEKYVTNMDGYIYKADIFALGVTIQRIANKLEINNNKLFDLIQKMIQFDPNNRPNINQCLEHPLFKSNSVIPIV